MRYLGMHQMNHSYWIDIMNQSKYKNSGSDQYNQGELITLLESRVAELLDQPQAMFFNKGTTCQLAALKAVCEQKNKPHIAIHPQSHIAIDEDDAYQYLMGLKASMVGQTDHPIVVSDLANITPVPAVMVVELPLRRAGFKLPSWQQLCDLQNWCKDHHVHYHMDGARLWESASFYNKSLAEICALFDSVYVSLYKGIGGISGALLLGSENFLRQCQPWRNRLGSNMWTTFPALITALEGLDNNLPNIPQRVSRAHEIAQAIRHIPGLKVPIPQTNGFQIKVKCSHNSVNENLTQLEQTHDMVLCRPFVAVAHQPHMQMTEIQVGDGHEQISTDEVVSFFLDLSANLIE